jgi:hypothetical protein
MAERAFEARFEEPAPMIEYLAKLGVAKGSVARRTAVAEAPLPPAEKAPPIAPQRNTAGVYFDAGGRFAALSYQSTSTSINAAGGVLANSGYGNGADSRKELRSLGLDYVMGSSPRPPCG